MSGILKLNFRGTVIHAEKSSLARHDGFSNLLAVSNQNPHLEPLFVDRDPKHFLKLLDYIRDKEILLPESEVEINEICEEARHFNLHYLIFKCQQKVENMKLKNKFRHLNGSAEILEAVGNSEKTVIIFYYTIDLSKESVPIQALEEFIDEYKHKYDIYFHKEEAIKWFSCKLISKTRVVNVLDANPKDIHFCLDEVRRILGTL
ncbi:hypothetical protein CRE_06704 [Caenorhabditis remanei]|uniref:Uncharacterized protein n=1 Tax=Caenorhabditis remanei TaxID=31234 RepID=E3M142_CAERE|nr:hypothetical protein CRE_06704 [Caenorhabditis remanei]